MLTIYILVAITAITDACKKYEEGPLISFISARNRIYGAYEITSYKVNGVDSLTVFKDSLGEYFQFYCGYDDILFITGNRPVGKIGWLICTWDLADKNRIIRIKSAQGDIGTGPFGNDITPELTLLKLKNYSIKMKTNYNNNDYVIELEGI